MGRRTFGISMTQINRMISASNARQQAREREELIASQRGISREQKPQYNIISFDFNKESRVCHVEFLESTKYRKIEKYVTQNGQRYPIYSDWLVKTKKIKKTIKLTNENLENLNHYNDKLISLFCYEIVARIKCEDLFPSWFIIQTLQNEEQLEIERIKQNYENLILKKNNDINRIRSDLKIIEVKKNNIIIELKKKTKKETRLQRSIQNASNQQYFVLLSIITFGIHSLIHSKSRILKLEKQLELTSNIIMNIKNDISSFDVESENLSNKISNFIEQINDYNLTKNGAIKKIKKEYHEKKLLITPLPIELDDSIQENFIPLKKLSGMNYEKIIGCYVIRNIENNKCYVGQSKDVLKRICKQHFDGTKVKNIIFAEDYYSSKLKNKDDMFEVRIIRLTTKDELDQKEKDLIEEYDSFNNGYNGTNGNN